MRVRMSPVKKTNQQTPGVRTLGAIDIGSNSIRMAIAQAMPDGRIEILERLQRGVRLGQDTFHARKNQRDNDAGGGSDSSGFHERAEIV